MEYGHKHSKKTKKKISLSHKGKVLTEDHKRKIGKANSIALKNKHVSRQTEFQTGHRLTIGKNNPSYKDGRTLRKNYCKDCNKVIYWESIRCRQCWAKNNKLKNNPNWRGGKSFEPYPLGWTKTFKEQIRYRDEYKCQLCGCSEIENCRKLDVHHIDYDKTNLKASNLVALCLRCHRKTNFNRTYWQSMLKENKNDNK